MHDYYIRRQRSKFEYSPTQSIDIVLRGSVFDGNVLPLDIAKVAQALPKVIPVRRVVYDADARHPADWLLRARPHRPHGRRTAEQRDELAPPDHSITLSAIASTPGGIVNPSVFAVLRLMLNSNLIGCSTGRLEALAPFNVRST